MTNTKYKKLCSDTVILALGTFGSKLLVFLLMPLYTALLSPDQYSAAELITGTANLIMPFACMGITTGIFRFAAEKGSDQAEVFSSGIALLGAGLGALTLIGLPFCFLGVWRADSDRTPILLFGRLATGGSAHFGIYPLCRRAGGLRPVRPRDRSYAIVCDTGDSEYCFDHSFQYSLFGGL